MKNKLNQYHYLLLHQSNYDENNLINIIQNHISTSERNAIALLAEYGINKCTLINLRMLAKNLITKYYLCHNNKQSKN